jgi:hypothetical protein
MATTIRTNGNPSIVSFLMPAEAMLRKSFLRQYGLVAAGY